MSVAVHISPTESQRALEGIMASAEGELLIASPALDPAQVLQDPRLQERGLETMADLLAFLARRGTAIRLLLADVDPLFDSDEHRRIWARASGFADVAQGDMQLLCAPHVQSLGAWQRFRMRGKIRTALKALQSTPATRLTPVQRALLKQGGPLRPVRHNQVFAISDGTSCHLGRAASASVVDGDFAGALRAHFTDCWNAAIRAGAPSLAEPPSPIDLATRAQSRLDLRLLRTFSIPSTGPRAHWPKPVNVDHEAQLTKLFAEARQDITLMTGAISHAPLLDALCRAASAPSSAKLRLILPQGFDQPAALDRLRAAIGDRLTTTFTTSQGDGTLIVVDGLHVLVGSARLTARAMSWDSEASVLVRDETLARDVLDQLAAIVR